MKTLQSLPPLDEFLEDLVLAKEENKDSFADEPCLSEYTYSVAKKLFTPEAKARLNEIMVDKGITVSPDPVGSFSKWTRFEDAHLPRLSNYGLKMPIRENFNSNVYTVFSPCTVYPNSGVLKIMLGIRLVADRLVMIPSIHESYTGKLQLLSPGIIDNSQKDELYVILKMRDQVTIKAGDPLLSVVFIEPVLLTTDNFVPPKRTLSTTEVNEVAVKNAKDIIQAYNDKQSSEVETDTVLVTT